MSDSYRLTGYNPNYDWSAIKVPIVRSDYLQTWKLDDSGTNIIFPCDGMTIKTEPIKPGLSISQDFVDHILLSGDRTIVFWADGTKTVVKKADDAEDSLYTAFTAALAIKLFGSNSRVKRIIDRKTMVKKTKQKHKGPSDTMASVYNAVERANKTATSFAELFRVFAERAVDEFKG